MRGQQVFGSGRGGRSPANGRGLARHGSDGAPTWRNLNDKRDRQQREEHRCRQCHPPAQPERAKRQIAAASSIGCPQCTKHTLMKSFREFRGMARVLSRAGELFGYARHFRQVFPARCASLQVDTGCPFVCRARVEVARNAVERQARELFSISAACFHGVSRRFPGTVHACESSPATSAGGRRAFIRRSFSRAWNSRDLTVPTLQPKAAAMPSSESPA